MTRRTDVHAPSRFLSHIDDYHIVSYIDVKPPVPPKGRGYGPEATKVWEASARAWEKEVLTHFPNFKTAGGVADHDKITQCSHCGHNPIRYVAVVHYAPANTNLAFGEQCARLLEIPGYDEVELYRAKFRRQEYQRRTEGEANQANYIAQYPDLGRWLFKAGSKPFFVDSMESEVKRKGVLSPSQQEAIESWYQRDLKQQELLATSAKKAERPAIVEEVRQVSGRILSVKLQPGRFGDRLCMLVLEDTGNRVYGNVPRGIDETGLVSKYITFKAKIVPSSNDTHFGFFSYASDAVVTA